MYSKRGVRRPWAVMTAPLTSGGRSDLSIGLLPSDEATLSMKGSSDSPKYSVASRGSSVGRLSTPSRMTPRPSKPSCTALVSTSYTNTGRSMLVLLRRNSTPARCHSDT